MSESDFELFKDLVIRRYAEALKESGERELLKVHDTDYYWGTGKDGSGENKMGKIWMKLRSEI